MHYHGSAKMLRLLRFRPGCAAGLPKNNTLNLAAVVFDCRLIAHIFTCFEYNQNNPPLQRRVIFIYSISS